MPEKTSLETLKNLEGDVYVYTDGSASNGDGEGGYVCVMTMGDQSLPEVTAKLCKRGRTITYSFDEEKAVVLDAVMWLLWNQHSETPSRWTLQTSESLRQYNGPHGRPQVPLVCTRAVHVRTLAGLPSHIQRPPEVQRLTEIIDTTEPRLALLTVEPDGAVALARRTLGA